jgi:hypothetical protein
MAGLIGRGGIKDPGIDFIKNPLGKKTVLPCTPSLPGGYYRTPVVSSGDGNGDGDGSSGGGGGSGKTVKTANIASFEQTIFDSLPNYYIEEKVSLIGLTANEILQVSHRQNFYTSSAVLNDNILNLVDTISSFSPTEIIRLQVPDLGYFQNNLSSYSVSLPEMSSIVTISIPNDKANSSYKVEVENFAPRYIKNDTIYT